MRSHGAKRQKSRTLAKIEQQQLPFSMQLLHLS